MHNMIHYNSSMRTQEIKHISKFAGTSSDDDEILHFYDVDIEAGEHCFNLYFDIIINIYIYILYK